MGAAPPPARQQRAVQIEPPIRTALEMRRGDDLTVGHHQASVGLELVEHGVTLLVA